MVTGCLKNWTIKTVLISSLRTKKSTLVVIAKIIRDISKFLLPIDTNASETDNINSVDNDDDSGETLPQKRRLE
ncbi:hypothetical protein CAEBREN_10851 [Caenorhabditis brenneri]|uniref:Uncharacterized protein n=1 Tax=Caenorhabditis brenneri TaxID=135651 RepID=G0N5A5_CAEBE|nr:hypothetical protein CAEBREN_10851 [Caenorhabditis brenneri]